MITANELRIGNWVNYLGYGDKYPLQIASINVKYEFGKAKTSVDLIQWNGREANFLQNVLLEHIEPFELTEEILLKIKGVSVFKWRGVTSFSINEETVEMDGIGSINADLTITLKDGIFEIRPFQRIEYLHDLQNIAYYKLGKQELEFNP